MFLEPVEVFARSDATASRLKPSKVTNTRVSNSRSSRSRVQRSRASNTRVKKRTSSRARKENRARRQNTRVSLEARWKRLPVKQKIKLYHSMVRTMAVLELSRRQRSTKTSSLYPFWQLFIAQAYAQNSPVACFLGGYTVRGCRRGDWNAARNISGRRCDLNGNGTNNGITCNPEIFPTAPCVYDLREARETVSRNYSTTQACAYADAQLIAQKLRDGSISPEQKRTVVEEQLNNEDLWQLGDPSTWIDKRNKLIETILGGNNAMTRYNEALLSEATGILDKLQEVDVACRHVSSSFEEKHCDVFRHDLRALETEKNRATEATDSCFKFHELPGEHFCQVKTGDDKYLVVRLERGGEENNRLNAVVYQSDSSPAGDYCLDSSFTAHDKHVINDAQLANFSNVGYPFSGARRLACNRNNQSHSASFTYQGHEIEIKKELGASNRCLFDEDDDDDDIDNIDDIDRDLGNDRTELFFPGIVDDGDEEEEGGDNSIYGSALEAYNKEKNKGQNTDKCIEASHVAFHEAGLLFNTTCLNQGRRRNNLFIDKSTGSSISRVRSIIWLKRSDYKEYDRLSIAGGGSKPIPSTTPPRNSCNSDSSICRKYLTLTDYLCGIGNAPSADGTGCETPVATEASSEDWTTGLANELQHCSSAAPASARDGGSGGRATPGQGG